LARNFAISFVSAARFSARLSSLQRFHFAFQCPGGAVWARRAPASYAHHDVWIRGICDQVGMIWRGEKRWRGLPRLHRSCRGDVFTRSLSAVSVSSAAMRLHMR
jgi:hypothetical protein